MMCDILIITPTTKFGQPEITLGIIPGAGGTQRLTSLIGKARAMDLVLTGRMIKADEAMSYGMVSRVIKEGESVVEEGMKVAKVVAGFGAVAVQAGKESVNAGESAKSTTKQYTIGTALILSFPCDLTALELPLNEGLRLERRLFQACFATADQKEGMAAFAEKRKASFKDE